MPKIPKRPPTPNTPKTVSYTHLNAQKFLIHDYFFAKALDKVRAGGVVMFITSKGTMDKASPEVRKYIAPVSYTHLDVYKRQAISDLPMGSYYVQEIYHENGVYYGQNVISKNMIIANRRQLLNGNSFILGVSGAGKDVYKRQLREEARKWHEFQIDIRKRYLLPRRSS